MTSLTVLDLSHNSLTVLPDKLFALPELITLNLSHNLLTALPFNASFSSGTGRANSHQQTGGSFFTPVVSHASTPLPRLLVLDASNNKIQAKNIESSIPASLTKVNLSGNPLGHSQELLRNLSSLKRVKEINFEKCEIGDDSLPPSLFTPPFFQSLALLDISDTRINLDAVTIAFKKIEQELNHDFSTESPPAGVLRILVGKRVLKEPWELEMERRANARKAAAANPLSDHWSEPTLPALSAKIPTPAARSSPPVAKPQPPKPKEIVKEAWEIEAEQGLMTEGGRRRARAAAAAAAEAQAQPNKTPVDIYGSSTVEDTPSTALSLFNPRYYTKNTQTLKLPPSAPPAKAANHARAFSVATTSAASSISRLNSGDFAVPTPTLPLHILVNQSFADSLRVLVLTNRRMDRSFTFPGNSQSIAGFLPKLEELDLEGCNLSNSVAVHHPTDDSAAGTGSPRSNEPLIPTLTKLFPSLRTLNLSYNALTSASLDAETLNTLIFASPHRLGLRHLRLRGNRIAELDGFLGLAEGFKGNRNVPECKLEELDLRDNEIGKLPAELGLLPLDVFLVDGNTYVSELVFVGCFTDLPFILQSFRVPQRRVWEREGTKGLLSWLRGRVE